MPAMTVYCVQPFWHDGRRLAHGTLRQFSREGEARKVGEATARRVGGALVYAVDGDPEFESWSKPRLLASIGRVPEVVF